MIVGYSFYGLEDVVWDTAIPTTQLDTMRMGEGIYDEIYMTLDTNIKDDGKRENWSLKTIMNSKFENDLEAGTIDGNGHVVTRLQLYRRLYSGTSDWVLIGDTDYSDEFNVYSFVDNTTENGRTYEYAIMPVANKIAGELNKSEPQKVEYEGVYISDTENNFRIELDFKQDTIQHNRNSALITPLNGKYPIAVFGKQDYRTSSLTFLPISQKQIDTGGTDVNGRDERTIRDKVTSFLNNGKAKILRNDNGDVMIIASQNVQTDPKETYLPDIQSVKFDYAELGRINSSDLTRTGLIAEAVKSKYTYNEYGDVIWDI